MSDIYDPRFDQLPTNPVEYLHRLAHDLAWGKHHGLWSDYIRLNQVGRFQWEIAAREFEVELKNYLDKCWNGKLPDPYMLVTYGYLEDIMQEGGSVYLYRLTVSALQLPEQKPHVPIFISYSRSQSSSLALLLLARFKEHNMSPFLDMHPDREDLPLGSDWEAQIKTQIQNSDSIIVLIGPKTLNSENVIKELNWAREFEKKIIPIWHRINEPTEYSDKLSEELKLIDNYHNRKGSAKVGR